jgi:hypothetical protein
MQVTPGTRLQSTVCDTEVMVVAAPAGPVELWCGGQPMVKFGERGELTESPVAGQDQGTLLGKRYADEEVGIEVLCTKSGDGSLSIAGALLGEKKAKPLPSSD